MQTTAKNLQRIRIVGETHYHPVLWYLPEYLAHRAANPDDQCGSVLLNTLRRIATIKRLPPPPFVEDKRVIVRLSLESTETGQLNINYVTADLDDALAGNHKHQHSYIHTVDKDLFFKYIDVFDMFYSRNRRRAKAEDMETMITCTQHQRGTESDKQAKDTYYWYKPTQLTDLIRSVLTRPMTRVVLGRYYVYLTQHTEQRINRILIDPIDNYDYQIKKGVSVDRIDNAQVMNLLNQVL